MHAVIAELQAELRRQREEIHSLQNQYHRPKPTLPNPEKFSGQSHKFDTWLPSIKAKLRVDGIAIGDSVAQFYYVYLNLESHVQAMVLPQLGQAEDSQSWDYTTILDQLSRVYDNPNKVQEAEDKLFSLKQGTDSISGYVAKFERILYEARGQNWPDVNKISTFRNGLNSTIRARLAQQLHLPRTYPDFVRIVQQLAGKSPLPQALTSGHTSGHAHGSGGHEPMEINAILLDQRNEQQRELQRLEKYCINCREHGHLVRDCLAQTKDDDDGSEATDFETLDWRTRS